MPKSCKCILDRMVFKGAMTEEERDKIIRNLKETKWHPYPDEKPTETKEYNITIKNPKHTTTAAYFTEDDTWYGGNDLYVPRECISAWAELPEPYYEVFEYCEADVLATEELFNFLKDDDPVIITEITEGEEK